MGLPTQPPDKTSITPFIIKIDFSPARVAKIYPSYFELGMCCSTEITISVQQQGQSKVLMLRNINCFSLILESRVVLPFAQSSLQLSQPFLACYLRGGLRAIVKTSQFTCILLAWTSLGFMGLSPFQNKPNEPSFVSYRVRGLK